MRSLENRSITIPLLIFLVGTLALTKKYYFEGNNNSAKIIKIASATKRIPQQVFVTSQIKRQIAVHKHQPLRKMQNQKMRVATSLPSTFTKINRDISLVRPKGQQASGLLLSQVDQVDFVEQRIAEQREIQRRKESDFLKLAIGLEDNQVNAVTQQSDNIRLELQSISSRFKQDISQANVLMKEATQRHHQWMNEHLGTAVYDQFRNLSRRD